MSIYQPYSTFIDNDGLMKVKIPEHMPCSRCGLKLFRPTEAHEWQSIARGSAVVRD